MNTIRNAILFGVGAASMTKDKIEEFINQLVKENNITVEEGRTLVKETVDKANEYSFKKGQDLQKIIEKVIKDLGVATKKDLAILKDDIKGKKVVKSRVKTKPRTKAKAKTVKKTSKKQK